MPPPVDDNGTMADADKPSVRGTHPWLRELPYGVVLVLTLLGVAYTSLTRQPIALYWELLAPILAVVCVGSAWHHATDGKARLRLVATQAAHWLAFLVGMNLVFLPSVQNMLNADATGLAILLLLALGTFIAGVHMPSWKMCALGLVMACFVPAIAWLEAATLIVLLIAIVVIVIGVFYWLIRVKRAID
jgi:hypothetical protein